MRTKLVLGLLLGCMLVGILALRTATISHAQVVKTTPSPTPQSLVPVNSSGPLTFADRARIGAASYYEAFTGMTNYVDFNVTANYDVGNDPSVSDLGCVGGVSDAGMQDFSFFIAQDVEPSSLNITAYSLNGADVTLIVNDPSTEWYCADQYGAQDPSQTQDQEVVRIDQPPAGRYDIWIGIFNTASDRVELAIDSYPIDFDFNG